MKQPVIFFMLPFLSPSRQATAGNFGNRNKDNLTCIAFHAIENLNTLQVIYFEQVNISSHKIKFVRIVP